LQRRPEGAGDERRRSFKLIKAADANLPLYFAANALPPAETRHRPRLRLLLTAGR